MTASKLESTHLSIEANIRQPFSKRWPALRFMLVRYLLHSWRSQIFPVLGVGIGVYFFTVVLSVMGGFVFNLKGRLLGFQPHMEIVKRDGFGFIEAKTELIDQILKASPHIVAVSPFQKIDAILQSNRRPVTVTLIGIDPKLGAQATDIEQFFDSHSLKGLGTIQKVDASVPEEFFPGIAVGREAMNGLQIDVGHRVTLMSTTREDGPMGLAPKLFPVVVSDSFNVGNVAIDGKWVMTSIDVVNEFFDTPNLWAGFQAKVDDPIDIDDEIEGINQKLEPLNLRAVPWTEANGALLRALKLERWAMSFVMFMIITVGCFGITIILILAVKRKSFEMAMLRAMGLRKSDLGLIYLLQGISVGALGVLWGLVMGLGTLAVIKDTRVPFFTIYGDKPLPVLIDWSQIGTAAAGSLVLAIVAALWPAVEVMRIDVVETLSDRR